VTCAQTGSQEVGRGRSHRPGPRGKLSPDAPRRGDSDAPRRGDSDGLSPLQSISSVMLNSGHGVHMPRHMSPST